MRNSEKNTQMPKDPAAINPKRSALSVIIITLNEAENLKDCLDSLADVASEIIIVDSGSNDGTVEIARSAGAKVIQTSVWPGFGPQKNVALNAATCAWVLSLDADERLTESLRDQICSAMLSEVIDSYEMPRLSYFCGKPIRHGGWYPDHVLRLFRRGSARFSDDLVHERVVAEGKVGRLDSPLHHYSYRKMADVERKIRSYSEAGAKQLFVRGKRSNPVQAAIHGVWAFVRTFIFRLGFLDGAAGYQIARMNQRSSYLKYANLIKLHNRNSSGNKNNP